jgi:hypothetical protein
MVAEDGRDMAGMSPTENDRVPIGVLNTGDIVPSTEVVKPGERCAVDNGAEAAWAKDVVATRGTAGEPAFAPEMLPREVGGADAGRRIPVSVDTISPLLQPDEDPTLSRAG